MINYLCNGNTAWGNYPKFILDPLLNFDSHPADRTLRWFKTCDIRLSFVRSHRFPKRREIGRYGRELFGNLSIMVIIPRCEDRLGPEADSSWKWHSGTQTESQGFIRSGSNNTPTAGFTPNHDRLAPQFGIGCLINRNKEGIQINVHWYVVTLVIHPGMARVPYSNTHMPVEVGSV